MQTVKSANAAKIFAKSAVAAAAMLAAHFTPAAAEPPPPAQAAPQEAGVWYDDSGKGAVQIEVCEGAKLCGRIVWLQAPLNAKGEPLTDKNHPKPERRSRPICGLQVVGDVKPMQDGSYDGGWVYDPKVGKAYDVAITLLAPDKLQVTGYLGMKMLGKKLLWTRAPADLPSCDVTQASAPDAAGADAKPSKNAQKAAKPSAPAKASSSGEALPWAKDGGKAKP